MGETELALRRAVFARPDDDAPRLVYADWLMERGEPLGSFIAAQLRQDASAALELLPTVSAQLSRGLMGSPVLPEFTRRGFLSTVFLGPASHPGCDAWGAVEALHTTGAPDEPAFVTTVAAGSGWGALRTLETLGPATAAALAGVARRPLEFVKVSAIDAPFELGQLVGPQTAVQLSFGFARFGKARGREARLELSDDPGNVPVSTLIAMVQQVLGADQPVALWFEPHRRVLASVIKHELTRLTRGVIREIPMMMKP